MLSAQSVLEEQQIGSIEREKQVIGPASIVETRNSSCREGKACYRPSQHRRNNKLVPPRGKSLLSAQPATLKQQNSPTARGRFAIRSNPHRRTTNQSIFALMDNRKPMKNKSKSHRLYRWIVRHFTSFTKIFQKPSLGIH